MYRELENGVFIEECKNRFGCKVNIKGIETLCYISSSSKLRHFLKLSGREVLVKKNTNIKSKTKYTLFAVKTFKGYILLNLVFVNKLLMIEFNKPNCIYSGKKIYYEKKVTNTLKSDFYIDDSDKKIVIEAKGIITEESIAYFPSMAVKRATAQLRILNNLLTKGYDVHYYVVLMNSEINQLILDKNQVEFYREFKKCLKVGMVVYVYKVIWDNIYASIIRDEIVEKAFLSEIC